jgi:hypothetical protein
MSGSGTAIACRLQPLVGYLQPRISRTCDGELDTSRTLRRYFVQLAGAGLDARAITWSIGVSNRDRIAGLLRLRFESPRHPAAITVSAERPVEGD